MAKTQVKQPRMPKKVKDKWIKALLSGEYEQAQGWMKTVDGKHCCLGVLRECAKTGGVNVWYLMSDELKVVGLTHEIQRGLSSMNDASVPFPVIAGFIKETL